MLQMFKIDNLSNLFEMFKIDNEKVQGREITSFISNTTL